MPQPQGSMRLRVALLPSERTWPPRGAAAVIDVLRATTVITRAIDAGAAEVLVCGEIPDAFALAAERRPRPLLCGERACKRIEGFDLGNSPAEYTAAQIAGRSLVMTTTNGTRAVLAAAGFEPILAASFNNLAAVVAQLAAHPEVSLICAGTNGEPTEEDILLAGAIVHALAERTGGAEILALGDSEQQARSLWLEQLASGRPLATRLRATLGGRNLLAAGFESDIDACAAIDTTDTVPTIDRGSGLAFRRRLE